MYRVKRMIISVFLFTLFFVPLLYASHEGPYPVKREHGGFDIKPKEAYKMLKKDPENSFIVDVRTRFEYQDIGHPAGAYNIPLFFYTTEVTQKGYKKKFNDNFCADLKERFDPKTDSLFMICRSSERSTVAVSEAIKCGFNENRLYNILGGFEGDKVHEEESPFGGQRMVGGWRLEGLPWTYKMDSKLMYLPDVNK